jgi:hypothetical protein
MTLDFDTFFYVLDIIYKNELKYFKSILEGKELTKIQKNRLFLEGLKKIDFLKPRPSIE